jgi:hypothetical protein
MAVKKRVILAHRFFQAQKMLSPFAEEELRSRVKGRLRPYAAWRSAPFTRRRSDTLGVAVRAAVSRLLPCKLGISAANFARFFTASNTRQAVPPEDVISRLAAMAGRRHRPLHREAFERGRGSR